MENVLKPSNYNFFPERDKTSTMEMNGSNIINSHSTQQYEFLPFHPVAVTSEMAGTSIEELLMHNFPTKRSWECSRLGNFPQELIIRLNYRSHMKFVVIKAKVNRPIDELEIFTADGMDGGFSNSVYRKVAKCRNIDEEVSTMKIDCIGNYLKLVFPKASRKTQENPFGQVSVSQLKIYGKKINHLLFYEHDSVSGKESIDRILIDLGLPLNDPIFFINEDSYEIAPVDEETKITLKDLLRILKSADKCKILIKFDYQNLI
jgi:centrosomal protein CEP104